MQKTELPIVDLFPVTTRPHSPLELALAKHSGESLREIKTYTESTALIKAIIDADGTGEAASAFAEALRGASLYKNWQKSVPLLRDVPNLLAYRTQKKHKNDIAAINEELKRASVYFSAGQLVYRGAIFPSKRFSAEAEPISTTMFPSVARWHAIKSSGEIGVLRVAKPQSVLAFPYGTAGNQRLKHEYEVLVLGPLVFEQTAETQHHDVVIKHFDVWREDA